MVSLDDLKTYPKMTRWFELRLLGKLLLQVIVSKLFGQYADRRLILAALDPVDSKQLNDRAELHYNKDDVGPVWFDYVSDLGDGFDATYAVAYCLAQEMLSVDPAPAQPGEPANKPREKVPLPRGRLLVMGGDEVYPTSSREDYDERLRAPYDLAFPNKGEEDRNHPPVYMVPGNHDWYDGLVAFLAMFCRKKQTSVGNWRTPQRRSYFALRLTGDWWLWAIDIALTEDMDQPQAEYFVAIAQRMEPGAKIILCTAEPGWYDADSKAAAFRTLSYAAKLADNAGRDFRIVAALSGDTHHYAHYRSQFGTRFVTSGGGGAFLHGTHGLKPEIEIDWLKTRNQTLTLRHRYPSEAESHRLLSGNLRFPLLNWDFAAALGVIYWLLAAWMTTVPRLDITIVSFLIVFAGFAAYFGYQERGKIAAADLDPSDRPTEIDRNIKKGKAVVSVLRAPFLQAAAHFLTLYLLAFGFAALNQTLFGVAPRGWASFALLGIEIVSIGGALAGLIFGLNLWISSRFFGLSHNDAFSAMRLDCYRHFLRLRIEGDELTIYPVGLDRVPKRHEWLVNPQAGQGPVGSAFHQPAIIRPHLIEDPIRIHADEVRAIARAAKPAGAPGTAAGASAVTPTEAPASPARPT